MLSTLETTFVQTALGQGLRLDQRAAFDARSTDIQYNQDKRGHVIVCLGQTKVLSMVTAEVVRPFPDRPLEGQLSLFVEYSPVATAAEESGDLEDEEQRIQRFLDRIIKAGRAVDTESLCIVPGEQVWAIRVDVHVLDDCGGILDAACLAAVAALADFRRPDVTVSEGQVTIHSAFERHFVPLTVHFYPVCTSFALFDLIEGDRLIQKDSRAVSVLDPTKIEERIADGRLSIVMTRQGELITVVKTGGVAVDLDFVHTECLSVARQRAILLSDQLHNRPK